MEDLEDLRQDMVVQHPQEVSLLSTELPLVPVVLEEEMEAIQVEVREDLVELVVTEVLEAMIVKMMDKVNLPTMNSLMK